MKSEEKTVRKTLDVPVSALKIAAPQAIEAGISLKTYLESIIIKGIGASKK